MTVLSTLRYCYRWWQQSMAQIPVAADSCWGCGKSHGQVTGQSDEDNVDWHAETCFRVRENRHVPRFLPHEVLEYDALQITVRYECAAHWELIATPKLKRKGQRIQVLLGAYIRLFNRLQNSF